MTRPNLSAEHGFSSALVPPFVVKTADIEAVPTGAVFDRSIGDILRHANNLSDAHIEQIVTHQRKHQSRFGQSAVELDLVTHDDVLWALSQQFNYPYALEGRRHDNQELVVAANPFGDEAEAFRELRSQLLMGVLGPEEPRRALAVVSPDVRDGKTYLAANVAVVFSQLGGQTLIIDADMRTPRLHQVFDVDNSAGLSSILAGRSQTDVVHRLRDLPNLSVLPVGTVPPNPLELVQRPAFTLVLHEFLAKFDYVVVDTPAAVHGADARVVAAKCGAALVIGRRGTSRMQAMQALIKSLVKGPASIAGVVLNDY